MTAGANGGRFTATFNISGPAEFVARWAGDSGRQGAGSSVLAVTVQQVGSHLRARDARTLGTTCPAPACSALTFLATGALHFLRPRMYEAIMPRYLPAHRELVYASGVAEIAGGAGVLLAEDAAARGLVADRHARSRSSRPTSRWPCTPSASSGSRQPLLWARLPLQGVLIAWAWRTAAR